MQHKVLLALIGFLLLSPATSYLLRAAAVDSTDTITDTTAGEVEPSVLVYTITIDGAIGAVASDRIDEALGQAEASNAELLVILLDTPGGFSQPTWSICKSLLNSQVPVCVYISPPGARAGSAGVYMTYSSHIAAMAPSTNIGAAHPVMGGKVPDSVMNEKVTNDAVAQIRAAAERYGRNADWAEKAVRESVSITANDALKLNVVDIVAEDLDDLFQQLDGREIELPLAAKVLNLKKVKTEEILPTWVHKFLEVITQPDIVLILFSIGGLGIVLELYNPGAILPGVVGAISLILAFYASQTLPINYAGVALIILALILWIAEVKVVSHGLLTVGGIISFFLGGLMLIDTVDPELGVSMSVLITLTVAVGLIVAVVLWLVVKAARRQPFTGDKGMIGKIAEVRRDGLVFVDGALWKAECDEELEIGKKVEIVGMDKLILKVKRTDS